MNTDKMTTNYLLEDFRVQVKNNFDMLNVESNDTPKIYFNGVANGYAQMASSINNNATTYPFTIYTEQMFVTGSTIRFKFYKLSGTIGFYFAHLSNNKSYFNVTDGTNTMTITSTGTITDGGFHKIFVIIGTNLATSYLVIDGIVDTTAVFSGAYPNLTKTNSGLLYVGGVNGSNHENEVKAYRFFNRALTTTEAIFYTYNSLLFADTKANNTTLSSGTLIIGKRYRVLTAGTGIVINGSTKTAGTEIIATSTAVTWNSGTVVQIGCTVDCDQTTMNPIKWNDKSNSAYFDIINAETINLPPDFSCNIPYTGITGNSSFVIPAGYSINRIYIKNTTANAVTGGIKIGTTAGGTDVVNNLAITANYNNIIEDTSVVLKQFFSDTANTTLYIQAISAWNSASLNIVVICRRVI